jgi:glycosyltransferase involved in cell wall biosynthesis
MRVGIDAHVLGKNKGGVERYVEQLVRLLPDALPQHQFFIFVARRSLEAFSRDCRTNVRIVPLLVSDPLLQRSLVLPWIMRHYRLDAIQVQRVAPWLPGGCKLLLTIHDLVPLKYPERYPGLRNALVRLLTSDSVRRASMILTPTQTVAEDLRAYFKDVRAPVRAFYNGVDPAQFSPGPRPGQDDTLTQLGLRRPYLLSCGGIDARRNIETLLRGLAQLDGRYQLVLAGGQRDAAYRQRLDALAQALGVQARVKFLGFVTDQALGDLYRMADALVSASLEEGFNIPPLEAMASGTPVICSDIPVHRELFGDSALLFVPEDAQALVAAVQRLAAEPGLRAERIRSSQACVLRYSWPAMAQRMAAFITELLEMPP